MLAKSNTRTNTARIGLCLAGSTSSDRVMQHFLCYYTVREISVLKNTKPFLPARNERPSVMKRKASRMIVLLQSEGLRVDKCNTSRQRSYAECKSSKEVQECNSELPSLRIFAID